MRGEPATGLTRQKPARAALPPRYLSPSGPVSLPARRGLPPPNRVPQSTVVRLHGPNGAIAETVCGHRAPKCETPSGLRRTGR